MAGEAGGEVTGFLRAWREGDETALEQLTPIVYTYDSATGTAIITRGMSSFHDSCASLAESPW